MCPPLHAALKAPSSPWCTSTPLEAGSCRSSAAAPVGASKFLQFQELQRPFIAAEHKIPAQLETQWIKVSSTNMYKIACQREATLPK
jgi:hypothetical protein